MQNHVCILTKGLRGGFCSPTDLAGSSQAGLQPPLPCLAPRTCLYPFIWEGGSDVSCASRLAQARGRFSEGMAFLPAAGSQQAECPPDHVHFALPSNTLFVNFHCSSTHSPLSQLSWYLQPISVRPTSIPNVHVKHHPHLLPSCPSLQ